MVTRVKRILEALWVVPVLFFIKFLVKMLTTVSELKETVRLVSEWLQEHHVFEFLGSGRGLILISALWITALIFWPEIRRRLPLWMLLMRGIHLRTWIDEGERHDLLLRRLQQCRPGERVRFISVTGKSVLLPHEDEAKSYKSDYPFPAAVFRGVEFQGVLLDPECEEADFRSGIETPEAKTKAERLLQRDARAVADVPNRYDESGIKQHITLQRLSLKYISLGLPFSLWLFENVALIEPYHGGKRKGVGNLCEFAQIVIPRTDISYPLLERHFENYWTDEGHSRTVWPGVRSRL